MKRSRPSPPIYDPDVAASVAGMTTTWSPVSWSPVSTPFRACATCGATTATFNGARMTCARCGAAWGAPPQPTTPSSRPGADDFRLVDDPTTRLAQALAAAADGDEAAVLGLAGWLNERPALRDSLLRDLGVTLLVPPLPGDDP